MSTSSYVSGTLMKGETIAVSFHPHKIIIMGPLVFFLIVVLFCFFARQILPSLNFIVFKNYSVYGILCFVFLVYAILKLVNRMIEYRTSEYTVTNLRVVMKTGVLNRMAIELMLNRLEAVTVQQSLFGQLFNYGTVVLVGVGGTRDAFSYVPQALYFRQKIQSHRNNNASNNDDFS
jgi:uncharacterized membrane protein YdbT with pleckstrin-like domain